MPPVIPQFRRATPAARAAEAARRRFAMASPDTIEVNFALAGLDALGASGAGILAPDAWPAADAAMAQAWEVVKGLDKHVHSGLFSPDAQTEMQLEQMKKFTASMGQTLELLKHSATYGRDDPAGRIRMWRDQVQDTDRWAKSIASDMDFRSPWGMIKDVTFNTAADVVTGIQKTGKTLLDAGENTLTIIKYAPYIALAGGGLLIYLWGRRIVDPVGQSIRTVSDATAQRIRGGAGEGATPAVTAKSLFAQARGYVPASMQRYIPARFKAQGAVSGYGRGGRRRRRRKGRR